MGHEEGYVNTKCGGIPERKSFEETALRSFVKPVPVTLQGKGGSWPPSAGGFQEGGFPASPLHFALPVQVQTRQHLLFCIQLTNLVQVLDHIRRNRGEGLACR